MKKKTCIAALGILLLINQQAGADRKIKNIEPRRNTVKLTFTAESYSTYQTQCSTNLQSDAWANIGNAVMAFTNNTSTSVEALANIGFYRIVKTANPEAPSAAPTPPPSTPPPPPPAMFN